MPIRDAIEQAAIDPGLRADLVRRSDRYWPDILASFRTLYGSRPDCALWESTMADRLVAASVARPDDLRRLDLLREAEPDWFQRPGMVGYSFYVDRFAGDLAGVAGRIGYLQDLGVRYLHPLPLLKPRPGDSDGGFAVADFRAVDPALGTMDDVRALAARLRSEGMSLCLDVVCNHTAREHPWAAAARAGDPAFRDFYHILPDRASVDAYEESLAQVFPQTAPGNFTFDPDLDGWVWTTFYPFQWDLNYANPAVFVEMLDVLLFLANQGAEAFRLDSIPFLWKRLGTDCRGLAETHTIVRAWRALLAIAAPATVLKAEAIVGLAEVLPFFGTDHAPECHLAYNNAAMTALWAALAEGDARPLAGVLADAAARPAGCTWLTYLRCHDDIIWGALSDRVDQDRLHHLSAFYAGQGATPFTSHGRAFQSVAGGAPSTNGMTASLVGAAGAGPVEERQAADRMLLLYGVLLALDGIAALYMGDELALRNDEAYGRDPARAGDGRWLHRPAMDWTAAARRSDPATVGGRVFQALKRMIALCAGCGALHGAAPAVPFPTGPASVLGFARAYGGQHFACLANFAAAAVSDAPPPPGWSGRLRDLLTGEVMPPGPVPLAPWQVRWLVPVD